MGLRRIAPLAALAGALVVLPPAAAADGPPRIAQGVSSAGVDLSGLTVAEAAGKLDAELAARLLPSLVLTTAGRLWPLTTAQAKLDLDSVRTAKRALRARPPLPGAAVAVPAALRHSRAAVRAFVARVAAKVRHAPRDATVRITLRRLYLHRSRTGKALAQARTRRRIDAALDDPAAPRTLRARLTTVRPRMSTRAALRAYRTVITIDRAAFRLRLFKDLGLRRSYGVAVGQPAYPTPTGLFRVQTKQVNPVWSVPNSPWAGELAGTVVQGGTAANPLKARWMGIANGVGIHGTGEDWSIGTRASHGCIRMHVADVVALYRRVPIGTPVLIR
jgi:lipoprotein-anchoring transpeptidase ErfK/SrfK